MSVIENKACVGEGVRRKRERDLPNEGKMEITC